MNITFPLLTQNNSQAIWNRHEDIIKTIANVKKPFDIYAMAG